MASNIAPTVPVTASDEVRFLDGVFNAVDSDKDVSGSRANATAPRELLDRVHIVTCAASSPSTCAFHPAWHDTDRSV